MFIFPPSNPFKMPSTVFSKPLRDAVFKHFMKDDHLRNSFIRALTPLKSVVSSTLHTNALRPTKVDENLLNIIQTDKFKAFMKNDHRFATGTEIFKNIIELKEVKDKNPETIRCSSL